MATQAATACAAQMVQANRMPSISLAAVAASSPAFLVASAWLHSLVPPAAFTLQWAHELGPQIAGFVQQLAS